MKIGILLTCYNCEEYVDACLDPWLKLRGEYNFVFAASSGMFKDYLILGIEEKNEGTISKLIQKKLDFLVTTSGKNLLDEDHSRNICLNFLKEQECDLILLLDGDEIYTEQQIRNVFEFVNQHPEYDGYAVNFKNYTIRYPLFLYEFCHHRIFWMNRHGGISHFHFDNQFVYNDGSSLGDNNTPVPKSLAYVDHYSWVSNDSRVKDKIAYQNNRYSGSDGNFPEELRCSFKWNESSDQLEFNEKFWAHYQGQIPVLHEMTSGPFSFDFVLDFSRAENKILITKNSHAGKVKFTVENGDTEELYYVAELQMSPGTNFWIIPRVEHSFVQDSSFSKFRIRAYSGEVLLHDQYLVVQPR